MAARPGPPAGHREVPVFPLGMIQFPGLPLELQVFEPRYLALLRDLGDQGRQEFGVVGISSGHEVGEDNLHGIADIGCAVRIEQSRRLGPRVLLQAMGTWRFDSVEVLERETPYLMAHVRPLPDDAVTAADGSAAAALRSALGAYADAAELELATVPADPDELSWWVAAGGPLTRTEQLQALAAPRLERLALLTRCLRREALLLRSTGSVPFDSDRRPSPN